MARTRLRALAPVIGLLAVPAVAAAPAAAAGGVAARATGASVVVASGLANPRHLSIGPDGSVYVAEAGVGGPGDGTSGGPNCVAAMNPQGQSTYDCIGATGSVDRISPSGAFSRVLTGIESVITEPVAGPPPSQAEVAGVSSAVVDAGRITMAVQDVDLQGDGTNSFQKAGLGGNQLGKILTAAAGSASSSWSTLADMSGYAAAHPQQTASLGRGPNEDPKDSDPFDLVPVRHVTGPQSYVVSDAAANTVLSVTGGTITPLAALPYQTQTPVPGSEGPNTPTSQDAQSVPTATVVGPDGALYVSELKGVPSNAGTANVYRLVPGSAPTVYATGFSAITALAFDQSGRLLVTELNAGGLLSRTPNGGDLVRMESNGSHTVLVNGLDNPTGLAVGPRGIYVSNHGDNGARRDGTVVELPFTAADGYRLVGRDGGVLDFGTDRYLGRSAPGSTAPVTAAVADPVGAGYWLLHANGTVDAVGAAFSNGTTTASRATAVGMAPTPDGRGYWVAYSDGGVYTYGDAAFAGSLGGKHLNAPIAGIAATPDGGGYWLVGADGGVFSFGDAAFHGSAGALHLNKPIAGIAATPDGGGYWLAGTDGGIFSFGDAAFHGSAGALRLAAPVTGVLASPDGGGYLLCGGDGGVFAFGDATFHGSGGALRLAAPVVAVTG